MAEFGVAASLVTPKGTITFNPATGDGLVLTAIDGMDGATIRSSVEPIPQRDGAIVHDFYRGPRHPVLSGTIVASSVSSRRSLEDDLRSFTDSILRADGTFKFTPSGAGGRQLTVRLLEPVAIRGGFLKEFQLALVAADPLVYSQTLQTVDTSALVSGGGGALIFPFAFPFSFGDLNSGGTATVTNGGNAPSFPLVRLFGKLVGPTLRNVTTGKVLSLSGLTINAGDYAECDMRAETILLNGSAQNSLLGKLDVAKSEFWSLSPGANSVRLTAGSFDANALARFLFRDSFI